MIDLEHMRGTISAPMFGNSEQCCVSLQKLLIRENLNPIRRCRPPRWKLSVCQKNRTQNLRWRQQTSTTHTKAQEHTDKHAHTHTLSVEVQFALSAQSCCLQADGSLRTESSVVVWYCYCPEDASSSDSCRHYLPALSASTHTCTRIHTQTSWQC